MVTARRHLKMTPITTRPEAPAQSASAGTTCPGAARRTSAVGMLFTLLLTFAVGQTGLGQTLTGSITGSVLAKDGTGLPGSLVTVSGLSATHPLRVVAGDRGIFRVAGLAAGSYTLRAEAPGFAPQTLPPIKLAEGESKEVSVALDVTTVKDAVTVVGRAPRDSVEAADIRESSARDVGEALSATPGLSKSRKGGIANDVVLRGFQSRDLNVLIDGQRIYGACPNHMDPPSFHADFAEVERVEVGKGPFDVKNQGSLGGVVNIVTKEPGPGWHGTVNVAGGTDDYVNPATTVSFGGSKVLGLVGYSYRSGLASTDGSGKRFTELTNYQASEVESKAFGVGTAWGKVAFVPSQGNTIQVAYTHQDADKVFYPALQMDAVWDRSDRVNLSYDLTHAAGSLKALKAQAYFTQVDHWMTDQYRTSAGTAQRGWSMGTMAQSRAAGGKVEAGFGEVTAGVEIFQRYWDATSQLAGSAYKVQASLPGVATTVAGVYGELTHPLTEELSLNAGARFDRASSNADPTLANTDLYLAYNGTRSTSRTDAFPSGYARLVFRPSESLEISGGVGTTVRVPEASERYYALKRMGSDWVGNPDLAPSRNTGLDLTASYRWFGLYVGASVYADRVANYVALTERLRVNKVPGVMNTSAKSYVNVDATLVGGEVNAVATLTDRLFLSGDVSYVRGTQEAIPAEQVFSTNLAEMPALRGRAALRYATGGYWGEVEGVASAAQNHVNTDLNEQPTPAWHVANLRAGGSMGGFQVTFGVWNLFNQVYYETLSYQRDPFRSGVRVPEPGRNYFVNVGWQF
jgi:iron complex outermembrane recepter protein